MRRHLAEIVHDLRTPLTVLCGTSKLILECQELERKEVDAALWAINQEAMRMAQLVDSLLHLHRIDADQPLSPCSVPVALYLNAFVRQYARVWPEHAVRVQVLEPVNMQAHVDPDALTRILLNLVDNAARYSPSGAEISIQGGVGDCSVWIAVRDEGQGMSPADARHALRRRYRGRAGRERQDSSGLGLAIVDSLVRQSQGDIRIETAVGQGTRVIITLPGVAG